MASGWRMRPFSKREEWIGSAAIKLMSGVNTWLFRMSGGWIGGRFLQGAPILLLTTTGRKSREPRTAPLLYLRDGEDLVVVASKGGMSHHPLWFRNIEVNPDVEVELGAERKRMRARCATEPEKAALWPRLVSMYSDFALYQARTARNIPVVILSPR